jgi:hypothetical protein
MDQHDRHFARLTALKRSPAPGRFWYPVLDARGYRPGDMLWLDDLEHHGRHEIVEVGRSEILLRPVSWREEVWRRWIGRLRRWWIRLSRR